MVEFKVSAGILFNNVLAFIYIYIYMTNYRYIYMTNYYYISEEPHRTDEDYDR